MTHSLGYPNTFIPFTFSNLFAPYCVAYTIYFAFCLNPFMVIWVSEYHAAALANPERDPGKVDVA